MSKLPYMQFYPSDYLNDPGLQCVSLAAQGLWMRMLCWMWQSPERGVLFVGSRADFDEKSLRSLLKVDRRSLRHLLQELETFGVAEKTEDGLYCNRRMLREQKLRELRAECGRRGGNPNLVNQNANQNANQTSGIYQIPDTRDQIDRNPPTEDSCSEPSPKASEPDPDDVFLTFPVVGGKSGGWPLLKAKVVEWEESFPGVAVEIECRKARQWCIDNPTKRKTAGGMTKFLNSWLSRAQNDATKVHAAGGASAGSRGGNPGASAARHRGTFDSDFAEAVARAEAESARNAG